GRRGAAGHRRHDRPGFPADRFRHLLPAARRERRRPGHRLGDDLPPHGGGALFPAARPVSRALMKRSLLVFIVLLGFPLVMITLAFAQMAFYLVNSMKAYGGDEGLTLPQRAELGLGLDLGNEVVFYYVVLFFLAISLYGLHRVMQSRFGRVVVAIRENEARAEAIGLPVYRYQLACFVIAGAVAGLAGALLASHGKYVNPNVLHWVQSGTLMIMVILGGVGQLWGGAIGAVVLLGLEHVIS